MTKTGKIGKQYTEEELNLALREVEDLMDQLLTPYFVGGLVGYCLRKKMIIEGDGVDIWIRDKSITQYVEDILKGYNFDPQTLKNGFEYKASNSVPIRVKVYTRNYYFFKYPDHVVYNFGTYQLPNPFDIYWKTRFLIR